jgi:hypothetical protein
MDREQYLPLQHLMTSKNLLLRLMQRVVVMLSRILDRHAELREIVIVS